MNLKNKIADAKKTTKIAIVGGAIVLAGSWGSCQLSLGDETEPDEAANSATELSEVEAVKDEESE